MEEKRMLRGHAIGDVRIWDTNLWDVYPVRCMPMEVVNEDLAR
jgi:hypothetical protein